MTNKKKIIVFQGEPGANSHIACREAYPGCEPRVDPSPEAWLANLRRAGVRWLLVERSPEVPFPIEQRYLAECAGHKFDNYVEWLAIAYAITLCCCPALSLPCGFNSEKLPVGLQVVAPPRAEGRLLAGAKFIEEILADTLAATRPANDLVVRSRQLSRV